MATLVLHGASAIDGSGGRIERAVVVIDGKTLQAIGAEGTVQVPEGISSLDVSGHTVLPGLIDAHVHVLSHHGPGPYNHRTWPITTFEEEQLLHAAANARLALQWGITTLRDMAGARAEIALAHALDDGVLEGPRLVTCGFVGMTAGHGDLFFPPSLSRRPWEPADGPDACRKQVRVYARDGADFIKICTSGGVLSIGDESGWRNYTDDEVAAIVDEAHALGMRVAVHAHSRAGIAQALRHGVDTLEHGTELDEELAQQMVRSHTYLCPTMAITSYLVREGESHGIEASALRKARVAHERHLEAMKLAHRMGVPMFAGTDSCNAMPFGRHTEEIVALVEEIGLSPMEALVAATGRAAEAIGLRGVTGQLRPGLAADITVVAGDPLSDIRLLLDQTRIRMVFRDGALLVDRRPVGSTIPVRP